MPKEIKISSKLMRVIALLVSIVLFGVAVYMIASPKATIIYFVAVAAIAALGYALDL